MIAQIRPYFILIRPLNGAISSLSVFIGAFITGTITPLSKVLLACLSAGLVAGGAYGINDLFDVEIDRINKPHRPLPSGKMGSRQAFVFSVSLSVLGVILGALVNLQALAIALSACLLLSLYSAWLKRTPLWGNLTVSLVAALAFVYGGIAVGRFRTSLIPAGFAFLFHLGREIMKDVEDFEGDRVGGAFTFPICYGKRPAFIVVTGVFLFLIIATLLPFIYEIYSLTYLLVVLLGVDLVIGYIIFSMWRDQSSQNLHRLSNFLKADMVVGLLAIYLGR